MDPSGGGHETDGRAGPGKRRAVVGPGVVDGGATACQDLGVESGSRKRQAIVISRDSKNLIGNKGDLEVASKDSESISVEIENLRSQLDEDVKELGYCEENQKLKVELALKVEETQCLRKQNEELQAKCKCLLKKIVEILENQIHTKRAHLLQFKRLNITTEIPYAHLEENKKRSHEPCDEEELGRDLSKKERESNIELQQARKELIVGLEDMLTGQTNIGIKRMGELDEKPFQSACMKKYGDGDYQAKAAALVSTWQGEINKSSWYPFKVIFQFDEEAKEVIDDNDTKLKLLQITFGDDVCNAVKTALTEINEYNPSGRYAVPELWNFSKGRKATMKEALRYLFRRIAGRAETTVSSLGE